jgi:hypothetical protein
LEVVEKWWTTFGGSKKTNGNISSKPKFSPLKKKKQWWEKQTKHLSFFVQKILVATMWKFTTKKKENKILHNNTKLPTNLEDLNFKYFMD